MRRATRAVATAGVTAAMLLLTAVGAELLARRLLRVPVAPQLLVLDPHTDYRNKPGVRERSYWKGVYDFRWTTNSLGFRGASEYAIPKPAGVRRVIGLGDSFTFGPGVNDGETWPAVLERLLAAECAGTRVEVVNAGVTGFSTSQELIFLERYGLRLQPDVVVLAIFVNDPQDNVDRGLHRLLADTLVPRPPGQRPAVYSAKRLTEYVPGYTWLLRHSVLVNWARQVYFRERPNDLNTARAGRGDAAAGAVDSAAARTTDLSAQEQAKWRLTELLLQRLRRVAEGAGSRIVAVVIPDIRTLSLYAHAPARPAGVDSFPAVCPSGEVDCFDRIRRACAAAALDCVDLADWFLRRRRSADVTRLYIANEYHFAPPGHALTAEALAPRVRDLLGCAAGSDRDRAALPVARNHRASSAVSASP